MLTISPNMKPGRVLQGPEPVRKESRADKLKRLSSQQKAKGGGGPLRLLPWPLFLQKLQHKRDIVVRAHVRWAMNRAIRACETLKRSEGRIFELRPGGRGNIVTSGGMYHRHNGRHSTGLWPTDGAGERLPGLDEKIMLNDSRYLAELEDNLRKLCCPEWAISVVKRAVRIKLALGWDLNLQGESDEV